jgi:hypothetical protein
MAFGINAFNNANEVIISSELKNLHFIEKQTAPSSSAGQTTGFGGRYIHTYRVNNCPTIPVPFFHMAANQECGITAVNEVATNVWDIEVLTDNHTPDLYVFADATAVQSDGGQGMIVYNADGSPAFDSRARPLAVNNAANVSPPSSPRSPFSPGGLNAKYCASNGNSTHSSGWTPNTSSDTSLALPAKPMFFYFSLGQAELEQSYSASEEECDGASVKGNCVGFVRRYNWVSTYWAFYRATISYPNTSTLRSQWTMTSYDCHWQESTNDGAFGIGTGGSSSAGGAWPYSNETINLASTIVIVGDASRYD